MSLPGPEPIGPTGGGGGGAALSDNTPEPLGSESAGVGTEASRWDHIHPMPSAADVGALGLTAQAADSAKLAGVTPTAAGLALLDDADAAAQRTTMGLGDSATKNVGTSAGTVAAGDDSRLSNARTPTAHAASHQNGGSDEIATATPGANAIPKAGAGGTLAAGWLPPGTSGAAGALQLATNAEVSSAKAVAANDSRLIAGAWDSIPTSPNADDCEYVGGALNGSTVGFSAATQEAGDPNPTVSVATSKYRYSSTIRDSWLHLQPGASGYVDIRKYRTFGTDEYVMARFHWTSVNGGMTVNDPYFTMTLVYDGNNKVALHFNASGGTTALFRKTQGGANTDITFSYDDRGMGGAIQYVMIVKRGTTYTGWVAAHDGRWRYVGSHTYTGSTPTFVQILTGDVNATTVIGLDYIRFLSKFPV